MRLIDSAFQFLNCVAGVIIVHHMLRAIGAMSSHTHHGIRMAFILTATGGLAQIIDPYIYVSHSAESIGNYFLSIGIAMIFIFDRRFSAPKSTVPMRRSTDRRGLA